MINKIIYSQILRRLWKSKEGYLVVWLITCISSFMFFFVQTSIDENRKDVLMANQTDFIVALDSNTILARTFLIFFMFILAFLYYMFFHKFVKNEARAFGCFISLGIGVKALKNIYLSVVGVTVVTATIAGNILGYISSDVLLNNYAITYGVVNLKKGLSFSHVLMAYLFPFITVLIVTFFNVRDFFEKDVVSLLNYKEERNLSTIKISNHISKLFHGDFAFAVRIALRKPFYVLMIIGAVWIFGVLFLFSISLNLSSKTAQSHLLSGRNYEYEIKFDHIKNISDMDSEEVAYAIETEATIVYKEKEISQTCYGIELQNNLFQLLDKDNSIIEPKEGQIIISPRLNQIFGINQGDKIQVNINGTVQQLRVQGVAINAENNGIYLSKTELAKMLSLSEDTYNIIYSNMLFDNMDGAVLSKDLIKENIDKENVSNRISALICQVLAVIVGGLLLVSAVFMNFEENYNNILRLHILGYRPKEINSMIVSVYEPIIIIGFLMGISPTILISNKISILLSMQTGDYIPFYTNFWIVILDFLFVFLLYLMIKSNFERKIKKINNKNMLLQS
mgnify:CR=1 FL=1